MIKKIPWKNIIIVFTAMLVVPVMAFAMTTSDEPDTDNSNIKITSDEKAFEAASGATTVLTSGALGYLDGATSATGSLGSGNGQTNGGTDAVSSATTKPGTTGSINDDREYEDDEDDEDDEDEEDEIDD